MFNLKQLKNKRADAEKKLNNYLYNLLISINGNENLKASAGFNFKRYLANELEAYFKSVIESLKLINGKFNVECVYVDCDPTNSISILLRIETEDVKFTVNVYMLGHSALTFYCNDELNGYFIDNANLNDFQSNISNIQIKIN
jgi:hypothetical protein